MFFFLKEVTSGKKFKSRINYSFFFFKLQRQHPLLLSPLLLTFCLGFLIPWTQWITGCLLLFDSKDILSDRLIYFLPIKKKSSSKGRNLLKTHWNSSFCLSTKMNIFNCELRRRGSPCWHTLDMMPPFRWLSFSCLGDGHIKKKKKSWLLHIKFRELSIVY